MIASTQDFVSHVAAHAGVGLELAERTARAVMSVIGGYLSSARQQMIAEELPPALAEALLATEDRGHPVDEHRLVRGTRAGQERELVASVCRVLAEELSDDVLDVLRGALPPRFGALLIAPASERRLGPIPHRHHATLAAGRPGSSHPISETGPAPRQHASVAADNPHATTKLSSAAPPEVNRRTLADYRPDDARPPDRRSR